MVLTRFGGVIKCTVCGSLTVARVHGPNLRETCRCGRCGAINRHRQIGAVACGAVGNAIGKRLTSLRLLSQIDKLAVYNTEASGPLHNQLFGMAKYRCSEYFGPSHSSGELVGTVMHQDLMNLPYPNQSFDLVLSSEVLEHVARPYRAHEEIHRVLKVGGRRESASGPKR
jgi:SAM-dependent methyltransferase